MLRRAKRDYPGIHAGARTVEVHKARLMTKLEARNVSELVRFALAAEKS